MIPTILDAKIRTIYQSRDLGACPSNSRAAMCRKSPGCKASGRRRLWYESSRYEDAAVGAFPAHPPGGTAFARPLRRGFLGVSSSPDTPSSPLLDARQNPCRRSPCYYSDRLLETRDPKKPAALLFVFIKMRAASLHSARRSRSGGEQRTRSVR